MKPILCVGETLEEREAGETDAKVIGQVAGRPSPSCTADQVASMVVAYEPIWAIGTGRNATPKTRRHDRRWSRSTLRGDRSGDAADELRILYGGSA